MNPVTVTKTPETEQQGGVPKGGAMHRMPQNTLAERIRAAMAQSGISNPSELARRMGVSRQTVQNWVTGRTDKLTPEMLYKLCDAVNVNGRWMALGPPHSPVRPRFLTPDEDEILQIARELPEEAREQWVSIGRTLVRANPSPSPANPYPDRKA